MSTLEEKAFSEIKKLADDFRGNERYYLSSDYQEQEARKDFIDKFFIALGWDVNHDTQKNPFEQEVKVERGVNVHGVQKRADYAFYIGNYRDVRFFVEAKKPHGDIATPANYFQTIRYGWNARTPLAVLTDFGKFHVLDCRYKPDIDSSLQCAVKTYHYTDYENEEKFAEIYHLFSREAVAAGSLEKFSEKMPKRRGKAIQRGLFAGAYKGIDEAFLEELDEYRKTLAHMFKDADSSLDGETLTEITQRTIDRLVFTRFLEDRQIEAEPIVARLGEKGSAWGDFLAASRRLDGIYNGIVFKHHDILDSPTLKVDDTVFAKIREDLSHLNTPYDFNIIPIHILGSIYERFLGKVISAGPERVRVDEKPEVRKAGGVYYTPQYIVKYIVENTVGKMIEGKTPDQIAEMRFADISCGSGSFLLGVFDTLLEYHRRYYNKYRSKTKKGDCVERDGVLYLSLKKRREILLKNLYGVDIDAQAVEVAQLSLYLKLLEDETLGTTHDYQREFHETLLPSLNKNIVCGNSLIGTDVLSGQLFAGDEEQKLNPMDFEARFPDVMRAGGFDAVVGNPPYIRIQTLQETTPLSVGYFSRRFQAAGKGNYDIYVVFVEKALALLNSAGVLGFILPHKFFNAQYGEPLRALLSKGRHLSRVVHFGNEQIFEGASTYTCLMFLSKAASAKCAFIRVGDLDGWKSGTEVGIESVPAEKITAGDWNFSTGKTAALLEKLQGASETLESVTTRIFQGIKTSADKIYIVEERAREKKRVKVFSPHLGGERWLEPDLLHPLIKGGDSRRYQMSRTDRLILFPYEKTEGGDSSVLISETELKKRYPLTWAYFLENRRYLEGREDGKMRGAGWHAYGRSQALDVMPLPKIFTPDLAARASFSLDETGDAFFTGGVAGGYGILSRKGISPKYCLALLNSSLLEWVISQTATQMRGGYFSFEARFIRSLPIKLCALTVPAEKLQYEEMIALVSQIMEAKNKLTEARTDKDKTYYEQKCATLDRQIDGLVYKLYDLTDKEIGLIENRFTSQKV